MDQSGRLTGGGGEPEEEITRAHVVAMVEAAMEHTAEDHLNKGEEEPATLHRAGMALTLIYLYLNGQSHDHKVLVMITKVATAALIVGGHNPEWARKGHWEIAQNLRQIVKEEPALEGKADQAILVLDAISDILPEKFPVDFDVPLDDML